MIRAGTLKEKVSVLRPIREKNESGGQKTPVSYQTLIDPMYCEVRQGIPSDDLIASQEKLIQGYRFITRYRTDIFFEIGDKIEWRGRLFSISGFGVDANRSELIIRATTDNNTTSDGSTS